MSTIKESWAVLRKNGGINFARILKVSSKCGKPTIKINVNDLSKEFDKKKQVYFAEELEYFYNAKIMKFDDIKRI